MPDPAIIEILDDLPRTGFDGEACRHVAPAYHPLSTEGARTLGGRWNPPSSFPVLYLALDEATTVAELRRHARRQALTPEALLPRMFYRYRVQLASVLDLTASETLGTLDLADAIFSDDMTKTQIVGEAAHYLGMEGILVPSATGAGIVLPVFFNRLDAASLVDPIASVRWDELPSGGKI